MDLNCYQLGMLQTIKSGVRIDLHSSDEVELKTIKENVKNLCFKTEVPAEVYNYGITYVWWGIAACIATVVSGRSGRQSNT